MSAYVSICQQERLERPAVVVCAGRLEAERAPRLHTSAYVSIRQHTSAYVSIRQHTSAYVSTCVLAARFATASNSSRSRLLSLCCMPSACIRQHTSAYVSIRQHAMTFALLHA
jgi:hypothetical protein